METGNFIVMLTFACCTIAHAVATAVVAIYARYKVQYLSLAWIMGLFTMILLIITPFSASVANGHPGLLHPGMLLMFVVGSYMQSIYTFGITMPGFLQWGRMWSYASPIIILGVVSLVAFYPFGSLTKVYSFSELADNILSPDLIMRIIALGMGVYYVINIFRLPHRMAYKTIIPTYLVGYCTLLGLSSVLYIYVCFNYSAQGLCWYVGVFSALNMYLVFQTLDNMARTLPLPHIDDDSYMLDEDTDENAQNDAETRREEDFNERNLRCYHRIQHWMQNHRAAWCDYTFNRDRLCEETGINRQLMLQCLRSQGYNNVHEYLTLYRVEELKNLIKSGQLRTAAECDMAGFATVKTARLCFERTYGVKLDDYISEKTKVRN